MVVELSVSHGHLVSLRYVTVIQNELLWLKQNCMSLMFVKKKKILTKEKATQHHNMCKRPECGCLCDCVMAIVQVHTHKQQFKFLNAICPQNYFVKWWWRLICLILSSKKVFLYLISHLFKTRSCQDSRRRPLIFFLNINLTSPEASLQFSSLTLSASNQELLRLRSSHGSPLPKVWFSPHLDSLPD